jgi:hypothetical protein
VEAQFMKITYTQHVESCHGLAAEWFRNHSATQLRTFYLGKPGTFDGNAPENNDILSIIDWKNPEHWEYGCRYILSRNALIIHGDIGDAVYKFGMPLCFADFEKFNWHYFWEKCVASETGRRYIQKIAGISYPVPNIRAIAHFVGLQMALKQLSAQSPV